jgi:hypothetical protein
MIGVPAMNGDAFIFDENGGVESRAATTVDNQPILDDQV